MFVIITNSKRLYARLTNHLFVNITGEVNRLFPLFFFVWRFTQFRCFNPKRKWCLAQLIFWGKPNSKYHCGYSHIQNQVNSSYYGELQNGGNTLIVQIRTYIHITIHTYIYIHIKYHSDTHAHSPNTSLKTKHANQDNSGHH